MNRTVIKVCGLTSGGDARMALAAGADWLGIILDGDGPRRVTPQRAREIVAAVPGATVVAVLLSTTSEDAMARARDIGATRVQIHGVDPPSWPDDVPLPCAIAIPVGDDGVLQRPLPSPTHLVLLDRADPKLPGGTGRTFPWAVAREVAATRPIVLAGGLGPDNVASAIAFVRPYAVDASSRLESAPGIKDPELVRRFVAAAREGDERPDAA